MKLITIVLPCAVALLALQSSARAQEISAQQSGERKLAVLSELANMCEIEVKPTMSKWVDAMLTEVDASQKAAYSEIARLVLEDYAPGEGRVGACYKVRVELHRDGWLKD